MADQPHRIGGDDPRLPARCGRSTRERRGNVFVDPAVMPPRTLGWVACEPRGVAVRAHMHHALLDARAPGDVALYYSRWSAEPLEERRQAVLEDATDRAHIHDTLRGLARFDSSRRARAAAASLPQEWPELETASFSART